MVISKKYMDYEITRRPQPNDFPANVYPRGKTAAPYCVISKGRVKVADVINRVITQAREYGIVKTQEEEKELEQELGEIIYKGGK